MVPRKRVFIAIGLAAAGLSAAAATVEAQGDNPALLKRGKMLWINRGCDGCHAVGKRLAGPDLAGLESRRSKEWIVKWLKNTEQMILTDSVAMAMVEEYGGARMPEQYLTDQDIEAILAYIRERQASM